MYLGLLPGSGVDEAGVAVRHLQRKFHLLQQLPPGRVSSTSSSCPGFHAGVYLHCRQPACCSCLVNRSFSCTSHVVIMEPLI